MKEREVNLGKVFIGVTIVPAFFLALVYFLARSDFGRTNEVDAMQFSYNFLLGMSLILNVCLVIFAPEKDHEYIPQLAITTTGFAVSSLFFSLGSVVFLIVSAGLGVIISFLTASFLKDSKTTDGKIYFFIIIANIISCVVDGVIGLALVGYFSH